MAANCEKCGKKTAYKKDRFCKGCRLALLSEMKSAGYLAPRLPPSGCRRTAEQRENQYETKRGNDNN